MSLPPRRRDGPAAIHGRVADADDQNLFADRIDVAESDGLQPIDADVNAIGVVAAGDVQILAARRAAADEDRVEALRQQRLHAVDGRVVADVDAHVENLVDLVHRARFRAAGTTGILVRIRPPGLSYFSKMATS